MSADRPLPEECARLAGGLRELRTRTGLSLAALADLTPYSKSSWERYLNGKKLPPRHAVEALCRLADEPAGRLLALWELAEQGWSGRAAAPAGPVAEEPAPGRTGKAPRRSRRTVALSGAAAVVVAVAAVQLFLTAGGTEPGGRAAGKAAGTPSYAQSYAPGCTGDECDGQDPNQMGCGAQDLVDTLTTHRAAGGRRLDIRYSARCGAVWVRAVKLHVGDRAELSLPGTETKQVTASSRRDTEVYLSTAMTATKDPRTAQACLEPAEGGPPDCFTVSGPRPATGLAGGTNSRVMCGCRRGNPADNRTRGYSSVGRAPAWHAGGQEFNSP
ncbi:hypothetical protein GCM10010359_65300 [Streptomyces morookaense]|nr:hypothetical protein GCM10010359_65300 [Streptomyces morookaense]